MVRSVPNMVRGGIAEAGSEIDGGDAPDHQDAAHLQHHDQPARQQLEFGGADLRLGEHAIERVLAGDTTISEMLAYCPNSL